MAAICAGRHDGAAVRFPGAMMKILMNACLAAFFAAASVAQAQTPREIDWLELMPPEDLKALEAMGEIDHGGVMQNEALTSTKTVAKMNGAKGKIPGYIVPVTFDDRGHITELFLVPYFGACIHLPPPPPNQIIYIKPRKALPPSQIWDAYWAIGTVRIAKTENEMALSSYSMDLERIEIIDE
ncbi:MAG: DUF3299 domain-containing protein [Lysobacteraceae bacterium]|nr:MAG: DUF3299 domain-containing protein [Xanthomonadaceae bacterium]